MNGRAKIYTAGKIVYYVDGKRFENSPNKHDGRSKAEEYCLDNFIDVNNIQKFDSRTECDFYEHLLDREAKGEISNLSHHFLLKIQGEFTNANGDVIPAITYEADFIYKDHVTGRRMVVDVKGSSYFIDDSFIRLKCMFDRVFLEKGLYIAVMMKEKGDWVEWKIGDKKKSQKLIKKQRSQINELKKQVHIKEMQERKVEREKETLIKYRMWKDNGHGLTKKQYQKLAELEEKYSV